MLPIPLDKLLAALPNNTMPPQSPMARDPGAALEVKTIGCAIVPSATNLAPLVMIKAEPAEATLPRITVPGSMVKVALFLTYTGPLNKYTLLLVHVVLVTMFDATVTVGVP